MVRRRNIQIISEICCDVVAICLANTISYFLFGVIQNRIAAYSSEAWISFVGIIVFSTVFVLVTFGSRINIAKRSKVDEFVSVLRNTFLIYVVCGALLIITKNDIIDSRYILVSGFVLFIAISCLFRYVLKRFLTRYFTLSKDATKAVVITTQDYDTDFVKRLKEHWTREFVGVVLLDDFCDNGVYVGKKEAGKHGEFPESFKNIPVVSTGENFYQWMTLNPVDEVLINLPYDDGDNVQSIIETLEDMGISVHVNIPNLVKILDDSKFNNINCRMISDTPMATFTPAVVPQSYQILKRTIDILAGFFGCLFSIPIILITAIPLKLESKGPLFFKQERVGKNGRKFYIYKLRSMYIDAEERKKELMEQNKMDGLMFKVDNDPRITKVGKFIRKYSIDELPQFFNVLKGDMSLVGTRPPTVDEFNQYEIHHKRRLTFKPGITGMWQVSGRSDMTDFEEVVKLDCKYIDNWSPKLELEILLKTVAVVLTHKGAE